MTDVMIKPLPQAETEETLMVLGLDDATAGKAMTAAMGSSADVSAAAHLPAPMAAGIDGITAAGAAVTAFVLKASHRGSYTAKDCWNNWWRRSAA